MKQERVFRLNLKETFPHLAAAPIVEAVIQWRARAGKAFPSEELRQQLTERLPGYPDCRPQHEVAFEAQFTADGSATQTRRTSWHGFRLTSEDKLHIAQFTRDGITFSRLAPYEDWNAFAAEGQRLWRLFAELAEPSEVQRLGVRFINRIALSGPGDARQYLANPASSLEPVGLPASRFLYHSLHDIPGCPFQIHVVQTVQPPTPETEKFGLILDIDVGTMHVLSTEEGVLRQHLEQMRWLKNKVFFSLLSKRAINLFEKGTHEHHSAPTRIQRRRAVR